MKQTVTRGAGERGEACDAGAVDGAEHRGLGAGSDNLPGDHRGGGGDGAGGGHGLLLLLTSQWGDRDGGGLGLAGDRDHTTRAWIQTWINKTKYL